MTTTDRANRESASPSTRHPDFDVAPLLATALTRSALEGARIVALHWLDELGNARADWQRAMDDASHAADPHAALRDASTSLHKARVALRRLRATLREHRASLDLDEGNRLRRSLRQLARATNALRDRDVRREWLTAERDGLAEPARTEANALIDELSEDLSEEQVRVTRAFRRWFDRRAHALSRRLDHFTVRHVVGQAEVVVPFARHLADRVDRGASHLRHDLGLVDGVEAQHTMHRIRIRLKRQRAMLAPFSRTQPAVGAWYALATQGQDLLGAMRDASLLADLATRRGFGTLADALRGVALGHFEAFTERWCHDADAVKRMKDAAVQALRAIADGAPLARLTEAPASPDAYAIPAGHGLPMEIERKFLLHGLPPEAAMAPSIRIEQGWLPGKVLRERLRRTTAQNGTMVCTRTVKLGQPGARIEVEEPAEVSLFDAMWPLTVNARIRKRRHLVHDGALLWEIDVFLDRDLVLAEVELTSVDQSVELPSWLTPFIVREVTSEPAYLNAVMAQRDVSAPDQPTR